jgi:hypothetical protein
MDWDSMDTSISTSHVMEAWEDEGGAGVIMEALL